VTNGAALLIAGDQSIIEVGRTGTGVLTVSAGGTVDVASGLSASGVDATGEVIVGRFDTGIGTLTVTGVGSSFDAGGRLLIGLDETISQAGSGAVSVLDGAVLTAGEVHIGSGDSLTLGG